MSAYDDAQRRHPSQWPATPCSTDFTHADELEAWAEWFAEFGHEVEIPSAPLPVRRSNVLTTVAVCLVVESLIILGILAVVYR